MEGLQNLLLVFAGVLVINATLSAVLWARQRTPMYRALFGLWTMGIASVVAQGIVQSDRWMAFAFGLSGFAMNVMLVDLVRRALELPVAWRAYIIVFAAGLAGSAAATATDSPFWLRALPVAAGSAWPLFHVVLQAVRRARTISTTGWAAVVSVALLGLHELDYPFLRNDPRFAAIGFVIAILVVFAISIAAPAVILERVARELRAAVQVREDFLSVASHELRTPLTSLKLQVELAHRAAPSESPFRQRMTIVDRQVVRLERLIEQLLDVSRIAKHRLELQYADGDLAALVWDVAAQLRPQLEQAHSTLVVHADAAVSGRWDLLRLEQVVTNLLINAMKFGPGKPIELRLADEGDTARLAVTDQGIGISAADQAKIFQPFARAVPTRNYGGMGLGLWISAEIVRAHGGTLSVASQPGKGAAFSVVLPKNPSDGGRRDGAADAPRKESVGNELPKDGVATVME